MGKSKHSSAYKIYCQKLVTQFESGDAREHAYRPALQGFIESFSKKLRVTNEPGKRTKGTKGEVNNKPDFVVVSGQTQLGFIETKDINEDLDEVGKTNQIERYCNAYPNLILTDYVEFRRYVKGKLRGNVVRIGKVDPKKKKITFNSDGESQLADFFESFLLEEVASVFSPQDLAIRLASLTRDVKKAVKRELSVEADSVRLHKLMVAFQKVLLADLNVDKFSDMFAQTLAYGFFAARVHFDGQGEFSRRTAATILPKTNPFLRRIFAEFANESLPDSLIEAVEDIVDLLKKTDIKSVLQHFGEHGRQDPVVHFYESFLAAYDPQLKKAMGVFYTPDPVVSYMVKSLDEILIDKFGRKRGLADDKTLILDPALGTGSYLHKTVEHIHKKVQAGSWDSYVSENLLQRIFGFEILMAPYAVAHLNLGIQLQNTGYQFEKEQRLGVYLTNTLEETAKRSEVLFSDWISEEADAAAEVKRQKAIMVVLGNPPYAAESQNDGPWIRDLMRGYDRLSGKPCANYFESEGKPLGEKNPKALNDDYVKFIRFSHWRIEQTGHGVLAFITNHGFLDNPTFRGMREQLLRDFDELYVLDLHGSTRRGKADTSIPDENVFPIQTGVSINFFIRRPTEKRDRNKLGKIFHAEITGSRESKFKWLDEHSFADTKFKEVETGAPLFAFKQRNLKLQKEFESGELVTKIFPVNSVGMYSARDGLTIDFDSERLWERVKDFSKCSPEEAREKYALGKDARDWQVKLAQADLAKTKLSREKIIEIKYRPFDTRHIYYTPNSRGFLCMPRNQIMQHMLDTKNVALCFSRPMSPKFQFSVHCSDSIVDQCVVGNKSAGAGASSLAPLYLVENGKTKPNLSPEILKRLQGLTTSKDPAIEFFHYCYAVLNSGTYKIKYKEPLANDFPRVQITDDPKMFQKLAKLGKELIEIHLLKDDRLQGGQVDFPTKGSNLVEAVRFDEKASRVYINKSQYFSGVSKEYWLRDVGGYQVLEKWLKDRRETKLSHHDIGHYETIVESFKRSDKLVEAIDGVIEDMGGWPIAVKASPKVKRAA